MDKKQFMLSSLKELLLEGETLHYPYTACLSRAE